MGSLAFLQKQVPLHFFITSVPRSLLKSAETTELVAMYTGAQDPERAGQVTPPSSSSLKCEN